MDKASEYLSSDIFALSLSVHTFLLTVPWVCHLDLSHPLGFTSLQLSPVNSVRAQLLCGFLHELKKLQFYLPWAVILLLLYIHCSVWCS